MPNFTNLSLQEALQKVLAHTKPTTKSHYLPTMDAVGSVLAEDVVVQKNVPSFDNSAMDGFAYRYSDAGKTLKVVAKVFAGTKEMPVVQEGECCKIMTGAKVPPNLDTIVPIERCSDVSERSVFVPKEIKQGSNLRKKAEELQTGEVLIHAGKVLEASHIALLASQGITTLKTFKPLTIAVVSSGDEIKEPWESADEDEIYNANAFGIRAFLNRYGFDTHYIGKIPDDLEASTKFIAHLTNYDVIITTGGISMGDADFLYKAFEVNGLESFFHGVNVKPGRATMMGRIGETLVMALPGNPLTTMLNLFTLSLPPLMKKQGAKNFYHSAFSLQSAKSLQLRAGRDNMVLGYIENGLFYPTNDNKIGSGMLSPLAKSSVIAYFDTQCEGFEAHTYIKVVPLSTVSLCSEMEFLNRG